MFDINILIHLRKREKALNRRKDEQLGRQTATGTGRQQYDPIKCSMSYFFWWYRTKTIINHSSFSTELGIRRPIISDVHTRHHPPHPSCPQESLRNPQDTAGQRGHATCATRRQVGRVLHHDLLSILIISV